MIKKAILSLILSTSIQTIEAQNTYPQDFAKPLKIPFSLAGTFGELRSNHYHAGLDLRTQQKEGFNVYAIQEGYVSRIKVSPWGYGNALYITHPNGYTSVYAHLQKYSGKIGEYVRKKQYEKKNFEIDIYPKSTDLPITKEQIVALSGNSGSSGGPHLHFEIRDTKTEHPMNPYLFGIHAKDHKKPLIKGAYVYPYKGQVEHSSRNKKAVIFPKGSLNTTRAIKASGKIGIGVRTEDRHDLSGFRLGVYTIDMYVNDSLHYAYKMDRFSFDQTRYLNAHADYQHKHKVGSWIHRMFVLPGDKNTTLYKKQKNAGFINVEKDKKYAIKIVAKDFYGNTKETNFKILGVAPTASSSLKNSSDKFFKWSQKNYHNDGNLQITFPKGSFYDNFDFKVSKSKGWTKIADESIPVHKKFNISMKADGIPVNLLNKALIVKKKSNGRLKAIGGRYIGGFVKAQAKEFGNFKVVTDTKAPSLTFLNTKNGSRKSSKSSIRMRGSDSLSGIKSYNGYIDGKWVLVSYDSKFNFFKFDFKYANISKGNHTFEFKLVDEKGNKTSKKVSFIKI